MNNIQALLHTRVHDWMNQVGFRLNSSDKLKNKNVIVDHYFFKTFNFIEKHEKDSLENLEIVYFDNYGEKVKVRSLLDLQTAFFENLSELR